MFMFRETQVQAGTSHTGASALQMPRGHGRRGPGWSAINAVAERLFRAAPESRTADHTSTIVLVDNGQGALLNAVEHQGAEHAQMVHAATLADTEARLARQPQGNMTIVVSLDAFDCLNGAVDQLMAFRQRHPGVAVVIASYQFKRDDFSPERRAIADASIKLPASASRLGLAVSSARRHNAASRAGH